MSIYDKLHGRPEGSTDVPKVITARLFLGLEGEDGYTSSEIFLPYAKGLRLPEIESLSGCLKHMKEGHKIGNYSSQRKDRADRSYIHPVFYLPKGNPSFKVIPEAGFNKLISDYAMGEISIGFTLEELIEEALNSQS